MDKFSKDQLIVKKYDSLENMSKEAAKEVKNRIEKLLKNKKELNIVFAAAPSQSKFLEELVSFKDIDWSRINAFHLDEYIGLEKNSKKSFQNFLDKHIFNKLNLKNKYYIAPYKYENPDQAIANYRELLKKNPIDISCIGIGENGHIAFNDPHVADFNDVRSIKLVDLDNKCKVQQVNDECFANVDLVPDYAITMTVPSILSSDYIYCIVPGENKSEAVNKLINNEIETGCPASILRIHQRANLYLDKYSAKLLDN